MALSISFRICYFLLLSTNLDAIPITTPVTPSSSDPSIIKFIGWETEINICGIDMIKLMNIVCTECKEDHCYIEESYNRTRSDILHQALQCCNEYCRLDSMKMFCGFQSYITEYMTEPSTTVRMPETTTQKKSISILGIVSYFSIYGYFPLIY